MLICHKCGSDNIQVEAWPPDPQLMKHTCLTCMSRWLGSTNVADIADHRFEDEPEALPGFWACFDRILIIAATIAFTSMLIAVSIRLFR